MKWNIEVKPESLELFESVVGAATRISDSPKAVIIGRSQKAEVVIIRHSCMLALHNLGLSQSEIGRLFDRDHSSVKHALASRFIKGKGEYVLKMSNAILKIIQDES